MKILLRRDQRSGLLGRLVLSLDVRAEVSPEERAAISKYKLGDVVLFKRWEDQPPRPGFMGALADWNRDAKNTTITVGQLDNGWRFECNSILEMMGAEASIKEAAANFKSVLQTAMQFGGEEVVEL